MSTPSAWAPLRVPAFRALWLAAVTSNVGTWAHDVGAAWQMTSLTTSPLIISMLQAAASVPVLLLALPAGALADVVDRRRVLLVANGGIAVTAAALAAATMAGIVTPAILLAFTFALGVGMAFANPAWQATIPDVVPRPLVAAAATLNGVNVNLARAVGPALGGLAVAASGPAAVFLLNAIATAVIVAVVWRWRPEVHQSAAPAERWASAVRAGVRFVRFSAELRSALVRTLAFIVCGSALWALLPVVGRHQLGLDATQYGLLLGALGVGAVTASNFLPAWRRRATVDRLVQIGSLVLAGCLIMLPVAQSYAFTLALMFVVGMAWMVLMPIFNVAVIEALPHWVRARGLATYNLIYFAGMAIGAVVWGTVASAVNLSAAYWMAAAGVAASVLLTRRFPLHRDAALDLTPGGHWPDVDGIVPASEYERGPVLVTVEYIIDPARSADFLAAVQRNHATRRRDGAYAWGIYQDVEDPARFVEEFRVESWGEHMRQHARATRHDQEEEALARTFHVGPERPKVNHFLYANLARAPR